MIGGLTVHTAAGVTRVCVYYICRGVLSVCLAGVARQTSTYIMNECVLTQVDTDLPPNTGFYYMLYYMHVIIYIYMYI